MIAREMAGRAALFVVGVPVLALAGLAVAVVLSISFAGHAIRVLLLAAIGRTFPL